MAHAQQQCREVFRRKAVVVPHYHFDTHTCTKYEWHVQLIYVLVLERSLALYDVLRTERVHLRRNVETDVDVRVMRSVRRDFQQRAHTVDFVVHQYLSSVKSMHKTFVEPTKRRGDLIIRGDGDWAVLDVLERRIPFYLEVAQRCP